MLEKQVIINETTANEFAELVADKLLVKMEDYLQDYLDHKSKYILTREEAAAFLNVDVSTLYLWVKKGKINCYGIGKRRYYIKQELKESLTKIRFERK